MEQIASTSAAAAAAPPKPPVFKSRTDQLVFFATKLACLCIDLMKDAGLIENLPNREALEQLLQTIPPEIIVSYIVEADEKFGKDLETEQLSAVAKLVALASNSKNARGVAAEMESFVNKLEESPALKKKFFCYVKLLRQIIHS
jgi:hypothetical protein